MNTLTVRTSPVRTRAAASLAVLGLAMATLAGCSAGDTQDEAAEGTAAASASANEQVVELSDGWAKAADSNMTSLFGNLQNTGEQAVTLESISAEGIADVAELHETVMNDETGSTEMRRVDGGFTIEPGDSKTLEPGGDHVMLMELQCALKPGTDVTVELGFDGGQTQEITVTVRDFAGAQEEYAPGDEPTGHDEHSMMPSQGASELPECHDS